MFKKILLLTIFSIGIILPAQAIERDITVDINDGIYTFKIPLKKYKNKIKPFVSEELTTTREVFNNPDYNFKLVVNGGFFDPTNGADVSNIIIDKKKVGSLFSNLSLVESLNEQDRIEKVLNRTELRILEDSKDKLSFDIVNHFFIPEEINTEIKHSIQAGPMLLPQFRAEEESFIKYDETNKVIPLAADVLKRRERTIIGLKKDIFRNDYLYIIIFTSGKKIALNEARDYCKSLRLNKAMAMDGGGSTSINYDTIEVSSEKDGQRKVKSFLVIEN